MTSPNTNHTHIADVWHVKTTMSETWEPIIHALRTGETSIECVIRRRSATCMYGGVYIW